MPKITLENPNHLTQTISLDERLLKFKHELDLELEKGIITEEEYQLKYDTVFPTDESNQRIEDYIRENMLG